jgi:micrococcal nuclease
VIAKRSQHYVYKAKILRWVDGDTVDVDIDLGFGIIYSNQRVRLYGIDAPESRTKDLEEKTLGKKAKAFAEKYAPEGKIVTLQTQLDSKGKYGRILGLIIIDETINLNLLMVSEGIARKYEE